MNRNRIKEGDTVTVNFNGSQVTLCRSAKILNIPNATGDSWVVEDSDTGYIHYISEGCTISKSISANNLLKRTGE